MLRSNDEANHKLAKELLANCDFKTSRPYLLLLFHEFDNMIWRKSNTNQNYEVFVKHHNKDRNAINGSENFFMFAIKMMGQNPEHKHVFKNYMINQFNKQAGKDILKDLIFNESI